jgi:hypothetical protein
MNKTVKGVNLNKHFGVVCIDISGVLKKLQKLPKSTKLNFLVDFGNFCNFFKTPEISMQSTSKCFLRHLECFKMIFE